MFDIIMALALLFVGFMMGRASMKGKAPTLAPPDPDAAARAAAQLDTEDRLAAAQMIKEGRKGDAVALIKRRTRLGGRDARAIADHLEAHDPATGIG